MDFLLVLAVVATVAGLLVRNFTPAILCVNYAYTAWLCAAEVPFDLVLWLMIDVTTLATIAFAVFMQWRFRYSDAAVVLLFLPLWFLYTTEPPWASRAGDAIIAAQFLIVLSTIHPKTLIDGASTYFNERRDDHFDFAGAT